MSKKAGRLGDIGSMHGCYPPTPVIAGSPNVLINNRPAARKSDPVLLHACPNCPPHPRNLSEGSSSVLINGKPASRVGDDVNCGGSLITGSGNVLIGEYSGGGEEDSSINTKSVDGDSDQVQQAKDNDSGYLLPCE